MTAQQASANAKIAKAQAKALRPWYKKKRFALPIALLVVVVLGQAMNGGPDEVATQPAAPETTKAAAPATTTAARPAATKPAAPATTEEPVEETEAPEPEPDSEYGSRPSDQTAFLQAVTDGQVTAGEADNDMKRGSALSKRDKALCNIVGSGKVKGWTGTISSLDANSDGLGVVALEVGDDIHMSTWNNAFSDISDETLIQPGGLFDDFLSMEEGQLVKFSGKLMGSGDSCVNDSRLTLDGKLSDPDFIFKFSSVKKV
jgi:hypothetical protein